MAEPEATDAPSPRKPDGRFAPGNPGRLKGVRHKSTLAAEALLDGEHEALTRKAIDMAKAGDVVAMRLCLDRILPPRKDRPVVFELPPVTCAADHPPALAAIVAATAAGDLTPAEGQLMAAILAEHRKAIETADLDARVAALEARPAE